MLQFSDSGCSEAEAGPQTPWHPALQGLQPSVFLSIYMGLDVHPAWFFLNSTHHCLGELRGLLINTYLFLILSVQNAEDMQKACGSVERGNKKDERLLSNDPVQKNLGKFTNPTICLYRVFTGLQAFSSFLFYKSVWNLKYHSFIHSAVTEAVQGLRVWG